MAEASKVITPQGEKPPSPDSILSALNAFQQTEALKAGIDLDLFTALGEGKDTVADIAARCQASPRGIRILCDYFVVQGLLTKSSDAYQLSREAATFLDRRSPAYIGSAVDFLLHPTAREVWKNVAGAVRKGGTTMASDGSLAPEHPLWVEFARSMAPIMAVPAEMLATLLRVADYKKLKVLGLASGHGLYEISVASQNPNAEIWLVDWSNVLQVAEENAGRAGVRDRLHTIPGSALEVDFGKNYDLALLPNFIHHLDPATAGTLLRKIYDSLAPKGRVAIFQFVPNEDRVSPPRPAGFNLVLLVTTPAGEAYTYSELDRMLRAAGFSSTSQHPLIPDMFTAVIGYK